jgi:hypothetical protein
MKYLTAVIFVVLFLSPAEARHRQHYVPNPACGFFQTCPLVSERGLRIVKAMGGLGEAATQIIAHPAGCPARAFCGCGAAVRVFGQPVRSLWLAANWYRFPRSLPAPGTVAVRRHHVMVLESDLGRGVWKVYDANSGGHATRIHARSISGYAIVQPRA